METTGTPTPDRTPLGRLVGLSLGVTVLVGVITLAFAWPSTDTGPHEVPVAVIGSPEVAAEAAGQLDAAQPDGFDVVAAAGPDEAIAMIEEREVYAALAIAPDGVDLYTASAASPAVANLAAGVAEQIAAGLGEAGAPVPVNTEDVVAMPEDDPNGAGLAAAAFPMAAGGLILGVLIATAVRGSGRQAVAAALAPVAAGAVVAAVLRYVIGAVDGDYWPIAGALMLALAAAAWAVLGLTRLLGRVGTILGAVTIMLIGNPLSGMASAPQMLPAPWGELGQYLPPGAGATLLRSAAFFDGGGATAAMSALACWLVGGAALFVLGAIRSGAAASQVEPREPAVAAA